MLGFLSLGEAPEQLAAWKRGWDWFVVSVNWSNNGIQILLALIAALIGFWAWDVHWRLAEKFGLIASTVPTTGEIVVDEHYERTVDLLKEAAQFIRDDNAIAVNKGDAQAVMKRVWAIHSKVPEFLEAALRFPTAANEYREFLRSEKEKHEDKIIPKSAAWFLDQLADRLTTGERVNSEVDHTFVLPNSFKQYREADNWPKHHQIE